MKSSNVQWEELGLYIEEIDERNSSGEYTVDDVRGLSVQKKITPTKANMEGVSVTSYKILRPNHFAFVPDTSRRGDKMSLGYNNTDNTFLVSSISCVFKVKDVEKLDPAYLLVWFRRPEFDRYARFHSWGSAREAFSFEDMQRVRIPMLSIDKQRAIGQLYMGVQSSKEIAEAIEGEFNNLWSSILLDQIEKTRE